jgi:hypothetical protein
MVNDSTAAMVKYQEIEMNFESRYPRDVDSELACSMRAASCHSDLKVTICSEIAELVGCSG